MSCSYGHDSREGAAAAAAAALVYYHPPRTKNRPRGLALLEVCSVVIDSDIIGVEKKQKSPGDLYGKIVATGAIGPLEIYDRSSEDPESVFPGDPALLKNSDTCIPAYDTVYMDVNLVYKVNDEGSSPDDQEVISGDLDWCATSRARKYDKLISTTIHGNSYSATVNYIVLSAAVVARVEVTLLNVAGEGSVSVGGSIKSSCECGGGSFSYQSLLFHFQKKSNTEVEVLPGALIPLSKSVVAVHLCSSLDVLAELHACFNDRSEEYEIAKGSVNFPAQLSGTFEKNISGRYGLIQVKVTWSRD